ncbi:hypothetical protein Lgee_0007 [Legionella geestiana]|uniref:Uncharacterized protein n=1 Tax=Legionella geestiana TaxID=45065 RepID=A0A0W0UB49_9GAMM|nr:hypothetical protein [Legionella geestiana]KTD04823.1 hypothetical protein Lgee_0007 [Legionella geestiana]QBS11348.1 hypothetical protein E4T54_00555 [Legionella geestiana]QDQ38901.1 hypothetical protein E3226_000040 [Legionella geestiana]STX54002.1 Uncharacterised protein [Legionella geestiana]
MQKLYLHIAFGLLFSVASSVALSLSESAIQSQQDIQDACRAQVSAQCMSKRCPDKVDDNCKKVCDDMADNQCRWAGE